MLAATAAVYSTIAHFRARYDAFVPFAALNPRFDTYRYYTTAVLSTVAAGCLAWLGTVGESGATRTPPPPPPLLSPPPLLPPPLSPPPLPLSLRTPCAALLAHATTHTAFHRNPPTRSPR